MDILLEVLTLNQIFSLSMSMEDEYLAIFHFPLNTASSSEVALTHFFWQLLIDRLL